MGIQLLSPSAPWSAWQPKLSRALLGLTVLCVLSLAHPALAADKWRIDDFGTRDPEKLVRQSLDTPSLGLKARIRSYLAETYPSTPQGVFARAWLDSQNAQRNQKAGDTSAYEACVASFPKYQPCLFNLAAASTANKNFARSLELRQRMLEADPGYFNKMSLFHAFTNLSDDLKRPEDAKALLSRYRASIGNSYIWDYIEAQTAKRANDSEGALIKLEAAAKFPDAAFEVWEDIADLKSGNLYDSRGGASRLDVAVEVMSTYIRSGHQEPRPIAYLRDNFKSALEGSAIKQKLIGIEKQFSRVLSPELISDAALNATDLRGAASWVEANLPPATGNEVPYELEAWADANAVIEGMTPRVLATYRRAISNAYTESERRKMHGRLLSWVGGVGAWCGPVAKMASELEASFAGLVSHENSFELAICNRDVELATKHLEAYTDQSGPTYRADWGRVAKLRAAQNDREQYDREQPFLRDWFAQFGDRLELRIEFASGGAVLPPSALPELNKVASLLKSPAAKGYVFEISGHTDNRGGASLNDTLSGARAEAVVNGLVRLGVPVDRLRSKGYGLTLPLASNLNDAGRARNRRVEVRPLGTLSTPLLAQKGNLPDEKMLLVPGGRWAIMGKGPSYLWDLSRNVKLTEYAEGVPLFLSKNGRYLITRTDAKLANDLDNRELLVYDIKSGKVLSRSSIATSRGFALSPKGDELATANVGNITVLALPLLNVVRSMPAANKACYSNGMAWMPNDQIALSCASYPEIHIVNSKTLAPVRSLTEVDWVHSLAVTGDGRYLVAGNNGGKLLAWDTATWKLQGQIKVPHGVPSYLRARPDSTEVAINGNGKQTQRIDIESMRVVEVWEGAGDVEYSADGGKLYQRVYPGYQIRDLVDKSITKSPPDENGATGAREVMVFPSSNRILVTGSNRAEIFDMTTFSRVFDLNSIDSSWRRINENLIQTISYSTGTWRRFDVASLQLVSEGRIQENDLVNNNPAVWGEKLVAVESHDRKTDKPDGRATVYLLDLAGGKKKQFEIELVTEQAGNSVNITDAQMLLSPGDRWLVIQPSWGEGYGTPMKRSKIAYLVDTRSGKVVRNFTFTKPPMDFSFTDSDTVEFKFGSGGSAYALPDGNVRTTPYGLEKRLALGADREGVYQANGNLFVMQGGKLQTVVSMQDRLSEAGYLPQSNLLVARMNNGNVQIHDGSSFALKFTLMLRGKSDWIAYTPDGYFSASLNGSEGMFWNVGEDYLPFDSLRERLERPELIRQALGAPRAASAPPVQAGAAPQAVGNVTNPEVTRPVQFEADAFSPPYDIRIEGGAERQTNAETEAITVLVDRKRSTGDAYGLRFTVNGRELKGAVGTRGLQRINACPGGEGACVEKLVFNAELQSGTNIVQVSLGYKGMWLNPQTVIVQRKAAAPSSVAMLPRLWFFSVGVSEYAKPELNLGYPHADALALAEMFKKQSGKLYSEVNVKVLTNAQATTQNLTLEMNRFIKGAAQQDLIIMFFAGHGILDNDQTLYFVSHDANPDEPFTGLNVSSIQELLSKRPQAQKVLLWLDICHSGAAGERTRATIGSDEAIKMLAQGSGVKVMTSSTGREFSLEGADYLNGHGAFTAALLEGMGGQADKKVGDGDGYVSVLELETFVSRRVPEMTKSKQHPTTAFSSKFQDYPIAFH